MLKSMTGYGKGTCELPGKKINAEIRSLNSRQLDLNMRVPSLYREKETEIRSLISKQAERGKVDFFLNIESAGASDAVSINKELAKNYYNELRSLSEELGSGKEQLFSAVIRMPDVISTDRPEPDENEWKEVRKCIETAIKEFLKFRADEGAILEKDLGQRITTIMNLLGEVIKLDAKRIPGVRERLKKNVAELKTEIDENRFEQELVYYIEKLDITEEQVRLKTHCDYFITTMKEDSSGRKLGFISQEIGREINTIGSKANDAGIQKLVVQMKDELEKVKEQLLNIL